MKRSAIALLAFASMVWLGCSNNNTNEEHDHPHGDEAHSHTHAGNDHQHEHSGEHIYSCPMHPEVTSNGPGQCSKCGMNLEHTDHVSNGKKYRMDFKAEPAQLEAGKAAILSFTPKEEGNDKAIVPLDVVHDKKMHLIIVSKDLSYFEHIHPEYHSDGSYKIAALPMDKEYSKGMGNSETRFPFGGEYILYQDYSPSGAGHQLARTPITVKGKERPVVKYSAENRTWTADKYKADLSFDKELKTGNQLVMKVNITKDGKPVTDLDHYLGALGHMVVISEDTQEYLHVHPMDSDKKGPEIMFHTAFEKPGIYRAFLQFQHEGKIHTADYVIKVN